MLLHIPVATTLYAAVQVTRIAVQMLQGSMYLLHITGMATGCLNLSLSAGPLVLLLIILLHSSRQCFWQPQQATWLSENRKKPCNSVLPCARRHMLLQIYFLKASNQ